MRSSSPRLTHFCNVVISLPLSPGPRGASEASVVVVVFERSGATTRLRNDTPARALELADEQAIEKPSGRDTRLPTASEKEKDWWSVPPSVDIFPSSRIVDCLPPPRHLPPHFRLLLSSTNISLRQYSRPVARLPWAFQFPPPSCRRGLAPRRRVPSDRGPAEAARAWRMRTTVQAAAEV